MTCHPKTLDLTPSYLDSPLIGQQIDEKSQTGMNINTPLKARVEIDKARLKFNEKMTVTAQLSTPCASITNPSKVGASKAKVKKKMTG